MDMIVFNINISHIREKEKKEILNNDKSPNRQNKTFLQKEFLFRKQEKTSSNIIPLSKNKNKKYIKYNCINIVEGKEQEKDGMKYSYIEPERSISTAFCSIINNSELLISSNNELNKSQTSKEYIDINSIRNEEEQRIIEEMKKIKDPNLNDYQKRKKVLERDFTLTQDFRISRFEINIEKIKKENEKNYNEKINFNDINYLNNYEKREKIIKDEKTTTNDLKKDLMNPDDNHINNNDDTNFNYDYSYFSQEQSTRDETKSIISQNNSSTQEFEENKQVEKIFNSTKQKFYKKNKLYDLPLYEEKDIEKIKKFPEIYRIDQDNYAFLYLNDKTTNFITKSAFISEKKHFTKLSEKDIENRKYYDDLGLYFCEKEVIFKNEKTKKRCCPNEFICKSCMDINKKRYNIKNNYLINIKGRVAKINKGSYHCFGHFLCGNQIEDCISKFSCDACKMMDFYSSYYQ
jgi:hypothetical protein